MALTMALPMPLASLIGVLRVLKQPISQPYNGIDNGLANAISRLITGSIESCSVIFDNIHFLSLSKWGTSGVLTRGPLGLRPAFGAAISLAHYLYSFIYLT